MFRNFYLKKQTKIYLYFDRIAYIISEDVQFNTIVFSKVLLLYLADLLFLVFQKFLLALKIR